MRWRLTTKPDLLRGEEGLAGGDEDDSYRGRVSTEGRAVSGEGVLGSMCKDGGGLRVVVVCSGGVSV